jgi:hypothetical protein
MTRLGLAPSGGEQLRVTVVNSDRLRCVEIAHHVPISIASDEYAITCVDIDLGCFDFILGVDFLRTLGPITWDLAAMTVAFQRSARRVVWHGVQGAEAPSRAQSTTTLMATAEQQPLLDRLLQQHGAVFEESRGLPPSRSYDHHIHLLPDTAPIMVCLYRYP